MNYIEEIIRRFFRENYPEKIEHKIQKWLINDKYKEEKDKYLSEQWDAIDANPDIFVYESLQAVNKRITAYKTVQSEPITRYRWLRAAVILLPFLLLGGSLWFSQNRERVEKEEWIIIEIPNGEHRRIVLPDGTDILLNAGTTFSYPTTFAGNKRQVKLSGEAWFQVNKDTIHPFIVDAGTLSITVLGTSFNVNAYPGNERIITTLVEGKVKIETIADKSYILQPEEQLIYYNKTEETTLRRVDLTENTAWISGYLVLDDVSLPEIAGDLERYFDISVVIDERVSIDTDHYSAKFLHNETPQEVMEVLSEVCDILYRIENNTIYIYSE